MIQGDVYWYKFKEPNKRRPVLILTRDLLILSLNALTVAEITTTIRGNDAEVFLTADDGMDEDCVVNLVNIQTVPKEKLESYITHLTPEIMREVRQAIEFVFNLKKL